MVVALPRLAMPAAGVFSPLFRFRLTSLAGVPSSSSRSSGTDERSESETTSGAACSVATSGAADAFPEATAEDCGGREWVGRGEREVRILLVSREMREVRISRLERGGEETRCRCDTVAV